MLAAPILTQSIDDIFGSYIFDSRPSGEFQYEAAKNKLVSLDLDIDREPHMTLATAADDLTGNHALGEDIHGGGRLGSLMRLAARIDLESRLTVSSSFTFCGSTNSKTRLVVLVPS